MNRVEGRPGLGSERKRESGLVLSLVAVLACLVWIGCGGESSPPPAPPPPGPQPQPEILTHEGARPAHPDAQAAPTVESETVSARPTIDAASVVARINDHPVTVGDLQREARTLLRRLRISEDLAEKYQDRAQVLAFRQLVLKMQLLDYADKEGVPELTDAEVQELLAKFAQRYESQEAFDKALQKAGLAVDDLRRDLREMGRVQRAIEHYQAQLPEASREESGRAGAGHTDLGPLGANASIFGGTEGAPRMLPVTQQWLLQLMQTAKIERPQPK